MKGKMHVQDKLNLFLTAEGMKPASIIEYWPYGKLHVYSEPFSTGAKKLFEDLENERCTIPDYEDYGARLRNIHDYFREQGIFFEKADLLTHDIPFPYYYISGYKQGLERVIEAHTKLRQGLAANRELGLALGYPEEAASAFAKKVDGVKICGSYFNVNLAMAKQKGIEITAWLAYISFIPEKIDLVNNNVSESSKRLGEQYMHYVRSRKPILAEDVERHFFNLPLPVGWELMDDGYYKCMYECPSEISEIVVLTS